MPIREIFLILFQILWFATLFKAYHAKNVSLFLNLRFKIYLYSVEFRTCQLVKSVYSTVISSLTYDFFPKNKCQSTIKKTHNPRYKICYPS